MDFLIADTFTDSLARLGGDNQKAVKTTAFDLQMNPASPGMKFHKLDRAKDKNFWSVRAGRDLRLIVHKTASSLLLCYVDHHDPAYRWAERRKIERHPTTGAAQLVEVRERVEEIVISTYVKPSRAAPAKPTLFAGRPDDELLGYGVPAEWLADVRMATEDSLLDLADHLPREAAEALLELATGATPRVVKPGPSDGDPFQHPDARSRFRLMVNVGELERALDYPWDKWSVFLHPAQRDLIERQFNGPARVTGSAGTGKTVVALHRAAFLARSNPTATILLTTFSDTLASALRGKLRVLLGNEPAVHQRVSVEAVNAVGLRLHADAFGSAKLADQGMVGELLRDAAKAVPGHRFADRFVRSEWEEVVDAWQIRTWEGYRAANRLGRKTRLAEKQRKVLWQVLERVWAGLKERGLLTTPEVFARVAERVAADGKRPFDHVVIDEAQDVSVGQLRFIASLVGTKPNGLFFAGDSGQRIFQAPFSWKSLGVDIRGRSQTLRINYRTSHQIRRQADRLLPGAVSDVDGNVDQRTGTVSVFNGPEPVVTVADDEKAEGAAVSSWLKDRLKEGLQPHEISVIVRSDHQFPRARRAIKSVGIPFVEIDERVETQIGRLSLAAMHQAKGLEFRAVAVIACDDEVVPLQERIESVSDESDLEEVYHTERHLLYVACTRARDKLLVTAVKPGSEFLDDMRRK